MNKEKIEQIIKDFRETFAPNGFIAQDEEYAVTQMEEFLRKNLN